MCCCIPTALRRAWFLLVLAALAALPAAAQDKAIVLPTNNPDLEVTAFSITGKVKSLSSITINWSVRNASKLSAAGPWQDCLYFSTSRTLSSTANPVHCEEFPKTLAATKGYSRSVTFTLPRIPNNTYYLFMATNPWKTPAESSYSNNLKMYGPVVVDSTNTQPRLLPELDSLYVSRDSGDDTDGMATEDSPIKSLQLAVTHAGTYATTERTIAVYVGAGEYDDAIELPDNVVLKGANPFDPGETVIKPSFNKMKGLGAGLRISGDGGSIRDLTLAVDPVSTKAVVLDLPLLQIENAGAKLDNVVFNGNNVPGSLGVESLYNGATDSTISRCKFTGLSQAIRTWDSSPIISRNVFRDMTGPVILVLDEGIKAITRVPNLGIATDPASGFNSFINIQGTIVDNQTGVMLKMEANDWGGLSGPLLDNFLNGPTDHDPDVVYISFVSSLLVTVLDDETNEPVYNAEVSLQPSIQPAITQNVDGVYTYSLIPAGNYNVEAAAPGYFAEVANVAVAPPNLAVPLTIRLIPDDTDAKIGETVHQSDTDGDSKIDLSELLRAVQLYNSAYFRCLVGTEDGYAPGLGDMASCEAHAADFAPHNWRISLSELLRMVQLFSFGGYTSCEGGEGGYCAV